MVVEVVVCGQKPRPVGCQVLLEDMKPSRDCVPITGIGDRATPWEERGILRIELLQ